jgi:hypothetical protein
MVSSWRYLGTAVGFGFGAIWMTVGVGSAILVVLCAALGYGVAYVAERERAGLSRRRPSSAARPAEDSLVDDFEFDHFELDHFERQDEPVVAEPADEELALISSEAGYGWPMADAK